MPLADCKNCDGMGAIYDDDNRQFSNCPQCEGEGQICDECDLTPSQCECDDLDVEEDDEADDDSV